MANNVARREEMRARTEYDKTVIVPWLQAHGINPDAAYGFDVHISGQAGEVTTLTVHRYALNADGAKFYDPETNDVALDKDITVPLERWPENV